MFGCVSLLSIESIFLNASNFKNKCTADMLYTAYHLLNISVSYTMYQHKEVRFLSFLSVLCLPLVGVGA